MKIAPIIIAKTGYNKEHEPGIKVIPGLKILEHNFKSIFAKAAHNWYKVLFLIMQCNTVEFLYDPHGTGIKHMACEPRFVAMFNPHPLSSIIKKKIFRHIL